jgi:hypothetical protein
MQNNLIELLSIRGKIVTLHRNHINYKIYKDTK